MSTQQFTVVDVENGDGTSLKGRVQCRVEDLVSTFGQPSVVFPPEEKVTKEWCIRFDDGSVTTIYDWKRYEQGTPKRGELYGWHVGGAHDSEPSDVVDRVHQMLVAKTGKKVGRAWM